MNMRDRLYQLADLHYRRIGDVLKVDKLFEEIEAAVAVAEAHMAYVDGCARMGDDDDYPTLRKKQAEALAAYRRLKGIPEPPG